MNYFTYVSGIDHSWPHWILFKAQVKTASSSSPSSCGQILVDARERHLVEATPAGGVRWVDPFLGFACGPCCFVRRLLTFFNSVFFIYTYCFFFLFSGFGFSYFSSFYFYSLLYYKLFYNIC